MMNESKLTNFQQRTLQQSLKGEDYLNEFVLVFVELVVVSLFNHFDLCRSDRRDLYTGSIFCDV